MKAKVVETGEIVNVTPCPTWYKEDGQGPDRREWDEDELEFIYSNKKVEAADLEEEITRVSKNEYFDFTDWKSVARHFYELGLARKGE